MSDLPFHEKHELSTAIRSPNYPLRIKTPRKPSWLINLSRSQKIIIQFKIKLYFGFRARYMHLSACITEQNKAQPYIITKATITYNNCLKMTISFPHDWSSGQVVQMWSKNKGILYQCFSVISECSIDETSNLKFLQQTKKQGWLRKATKRAKPKCSPGSGKNISFSAEQQTWALGAWPEPTVQLHPQGIPQLLLAH